MFLIIWLGRSLIFEGGVGTAFQRCCTAIYQLPNLLLTLAVSVRPLLHTAPIILLLCERIPITYDVRLLAISIDIFKRHYRVLLVAYQFFFGIVDLSIIMYLPLAH
jgi:hypothetical protein